MITNKSSSTTAEEQFKTHLKGYINLIEDEQITSKKSLPKLPSGVNISDIKGHLSNSRIEKTEKKDTKNSIGKVSTFFKKSTNESCKNNKLIKDNIASLLQPGKASSIKNATTVCLMYTAI